MVDLDNFLNLIKRFLAVASDCMKFLRRIMGRGKERKITVDWLEPVRREMGERGETKASVNKAILGLPGNNGGKQASYIHQP